MTKKIKTKILAILLILQMCCIVALLSIGFKPVSAESLNIGEFVMVDAYSVRLNEETGLRFKVKMDEDTYNCIDDEENKLFFIIMPAKYKEKVETSNEKYSLAIVRDANGDFDAENSHCIYVQVPKSNIYAENGYYYANGGVSPINSNNYSMEFFAVACIETNNAGAFSYLYADPASEEYGLPIISVYDALLTAIVVETDYTTSIFAEESPYVDWLGTSAYPIVYADSDYSRLNERIDVSKYTLKSADSDRTLVENSNSDYKILVSADATTNELKAAQEIQTYLGYSAGVSLPIIQDSMVNTGSLLGKYISVGDTLLRTSSGVTYTSEEVGPRGYKIATYNQSVVITGNTDYGTLNGCYGFLSDIIDYEVYGPDCIVYDSVNTISLSTKNETVKPDIAYMQVTNGLLTQGDYASDLRMNTAEQIFANYDDWNHNSMSIVSPSQYLGTHPEWYSRTSTGDTIYDSNGTTPAQICYSNYNDATLLNVIATYFKLKLEANPNLNVITFGMQDNTKVCTCTSCTSNKQKYGQDSGAVVLFMNAIYTKLAEIYPAVETRGVKLVFLAYNAFENAPSGVTMADNVGVLYAPISADYGRPLNESERNIALYNQLGAWAQLTDHVFLWLYSQNFNNYMIPFNTFSSMQANYKIAKANNVDWILDQQQSWNDNNTAFNVLKYYLQSKLSWNVEADVAALTNDFFANYFPRSSTYMRQVYDGVVGVLQKLSDDANWPMCVGDENMVNTSWWSQSDLEKWLGCIDSAYTAVGNTSSAEYRRVLLESISIRYLMLELYPSYYGGDSAQTAAKIQFGKDCESLGITRFNESTDIFDWLDSDLQAYEAVNCIDSGVLSDTAYITGAGTGGTVQLGTYHAKFRQFYGVKLQSQAPVFMNIGLSSDGVTRLYENRGVNNALTMHVYYCGDGYDAESGLAAPSAKSVIGRTWDDRNNADIGWEFDAKTWGSVTVPFSVITAEGSSAFLQKFSGWTYATGGTVYFYFEYAIVDETYNVTFGNTTKQVKYNTAIGELPTVPTRDGYEGFWTIDGTVITAETVWTYEEDKTAEAVYYEITNSIGSDVWTGAGVLYSEKHTLGTYYIGGRKFYGEKAVSTPPALIEVGFAHSEEAVTYIRSQAPTGTNAIKLNVYFCGDSSTEPNAVTHVGYESNGGVTAGTVAPRVWGETTVPFSMIDTLGWTAFWYSVCGVTDTANGTVYGYYEYVTMTYTLSFDNGSEITGLQPNDKLGELPTVPTRDGYEGFWTIDGTVITAETVWTYEEDKTAEAVYYEITNSIGSDVWTNTGVLIENYHELGTYYIGGRKFYGEKAVSVSPAWIEVGFAISEAAVTYIRNQAPAGTNALKFNVYFCGDSSTEPNAVTHVGYESNGGLTVGTVAPRVWGETTVPFSMIDTLGWKAFWYSVYGVTETANGTVYGYYEYVTVLEPQAATNITTMDYKPAYSVYGTYTVAGRTFVGFYRTTAEGRQGYVDFGLVNATKTTIDAIVANAPEGYNALRMWVYYIGNATNGDEANAITRIGGAADGHPNAVAESVVAAKTWGSQTVEFSLITASDTGYVDFGWSFYAYTESWDASVYYYFEYVSI